MSNINILESWTKFLDINLSTFLSKIKNIAVRILARFLKIALFPIIEQLAKIQTFCPLCFTIPSQNSMGSSLG
jgi:hypothetical protein